MKGAILVTLIFLVNISVSQDVPAVRYLMPSSNSNILYNQVESRIINGAEAPRGLFPYQVGFEIRLASGYTWCGGSLISENYVLTAAHCLEAALSVLILFGARDRLDKYETGQKRMTVEKANFIIHKEWDNATLRNDIALIRLTQSIAFSEYIQPISLPTRAMQGLLLEKSPVVATGWGYTAGSPSLARYLQYVDVTVQEQNVCQGYFGSYIQNGNICIDGSTGRGACFGDSGSPLATTNGMRYVVGIASFVGYYGCEANWPTAYTRVSSFLDWIATNSGLQIL
ncbi:unnamed protein product [Hermetia illucens]|uniref:Peptidase S1 domain-containing protein n=1 Tax=Hermetia illucens TaxID=343691 RepID=A0A7R8YR50_HERIL|nr:unnamed protein product [Hermetia illucens]